MRNTIFATALLSATALANMEPGSMDMKKVSTCDDKIKSAGMVMGMGDQMVTIVQVADKSGALKYFPDSVQAPVGSIVQFQFNPKNHTVTESSFADPCKPLADDLKNPGRPGQKSGFVPVTPADSDVKVFNVMINDTKPIWIYCGQGTHCQQGMAMVINQKMDDPEKTIQKYMEKARGVPPPPGMTVPPPMETPPPSADGASGPDPNSSMSMSMSMSMNGDMSKTMNSDMSMSTGMNSDMKMSTSTVSSGSTASPTPNALSNNSTSTRPAPGSGAVTSGAAAGTPAVLNSFASSSAGPFRHAGLIGLFIAVGAIFL